MTASEAIERNHQRITQLDNESKQRMRLYQTGIYSKEQHNEEQSAINKERLATQLGIEALELYYELRQCTAIDVEDIPVRLPGETEGEK